LILATRGRFEEPLRFLETLNRQGDVDLEVIVVDQNEDASLETAIRAVTLNYPVRHVRSRRGLSAARNVGIELAEGAILAFPDDDCEYPPGLTSAVLQRLEERIDGVAGKAVGPNGERIGRFGERPGALTRANVWKRCISFALFLRRDILKRVGGFDETLGVGGSTPWGSAEEMDLVLRAISSGFTITYCPSVAVVHPPQVTTYDRPAFLRAASYGRGTGRVLRKHGYPPWLVAYHIARSAGGAVVGALQANPRKARFHAASLRGKVVGYTAKPD
jgi:GT2 family glycosyltransferase